MHYIRENKDEWVKSVHESMTYLMIVAKHSSVFGRVPTDKIVENFLTNILSCNLAL